MSTEHPPGGADGTRADLPTEDVFGPRVGGLFRRLVGESVGAYRLCGVLGEGGMGVVFEAEQAAPIRRRVALKLIKPGMDSAAVLARFEIERQALAVMDHPNIARVIDGGATDRGLPYFVMDLVRGVPITVFCDRHELGLRERIALFMTVCRAVQHAHSKGVIHRDLKPSNILVEYAGGVATPKVIDFGVAKAIGRPLGEHSVHTQHGQVIGTPEYMSPEQAEMSGLDIDTRADVYSLGVVLYELVAGVTPLDGDAMRRTPGSDLHRVIRETELARPSLRLDRVRAEAQGAERLARIAAARRESPEGLGAELRRDLDWIVLRCLEKDRERRYPTPVAISEDMQRYLDDEPVDAGPPDLGYRVRKFVRRNRAGVVAGACVLIALTAGAATTLAGMLWAIQEQRRASAESERARDAEEAARASLAAAESARNAEREARTDAERERGRAQLEQARALVRADEVAAAIEKLRAIRSSVPEAEWWWAALGAVRRGSLVHYIPGDPARALPPTSEAEHRFSSDGALVGAFDRGSVTPVATIGGVVRFADGAPATWRDSPRPARIVSDPSQVYLPAPPGSPVRGLRLTPMRPGVTRIVVEALDGVWEQAQEIEHGRTPFVYWVDWSRPSISFNTSEGFIRVISRFGASTWFFGADVRGLERPVSALWHDDTLERVRVRYDDGSLAEYVIDGESRPDMRTIERWLQPVSVPDDITFNMAGALTTRKLRFSGGGETLYAGSYSGWVAALDSETGSARWLRRVQEGPDPSAYQFGALDLSQDGRSMLASAWESAITVLDAATGEELGRVESDAELPKAAFTRDAQRIVHSISDNALAITDLRSGATTGVGALEDAVIYDIATDRDGGSAAVAVHDKGPGALAQASGGRVAVYDLDGTPALRWSRRLDNGGRDVEFSPDGALVACSEREGKVTIWDAKTGDLRAELLVLGARGHTRVVSGVAFHPVQPIIATATHDDFVRIWSTASGALLAEIPVAAMAQGDYLAGRLKDVQFHPSGDALAIAFEDRVLWIDLRVYDRVIQAVARADSDAP
jgi:serine/threonine protein kinase